MTTRKGVPSLSTNLIFSILLLNLLFCQLCTSQQFSDTTTDLISSRISFIRPLLPRINFKFQPVSPRFNAASWDYWESLGVLSVFGAVMSIIAILVSVLFYPIRKLGLCGGYEPMDGCCRGLPRKKPYPLWQVLIPKIIIGILLFCVVVVCVLGFVSNGIFNHSFEVARVTVKETISQIYNTTINLANTFRKLENTRGVDPDRLAELILSFDFLIEEQQASQNATFQLARDFGRGNKIRFVVLIIVFCMAILVPLLTFIAGIAHWKDVSMWGSKFGFYVLIFAWIGFAIHFPASVLVNDFCIEVDNYVQNYNVSHNNDGPTIIPGDPASAAFAEAKALLDTVIKCQENGTLIEGLNFGSSVIEQIFISFNSKLADADPMNGTYNYQLNNATEALELSFVQANPDLRADLEVDINDANHINNIMEELERLTNCQYIADGFSVIRNAACVGLLQSIDVLWVVFFLIGILEIFCTSIAVIGYKRFRKKKYVVPKKMKHKRGIQTALPTEYADDFNSQVDII